MQMTQIAWMKIWNVYETLQSNLSIIGDRQLRFRNEVFQWLPQLTEKSNRFYTPICLTLPCDPQNDPQNCLNTLFLALLMAFNLSKIHSTHIYTNTWIQTACTLKKSLHMFMLHEISLKWNCNEYLKIANWNEFTRYIKEICRFGPNLKLSMNIFQNMYQYREERNDFE